MTDDNKPTDKCPILISSTTLRLPDAVEEKCKSCDITVFPTTDTIDEIISKHGGVTHMCIEYARKIADQNSIKVSVSDCTVEAMGMSKNMLESIGKDALKKEKGFAG